MSQEAPQPITLRAPTVAGKSSSTFEAPPDPWFMGTWHVTHSTLPMWKKARNVAITYKPLASDSTGRLDVLVTYQSLSSPKLKSVAGVETPAGPGSWNWRGNGWLMIASAHWEVLGYGGEEGGDQWVVTYFKKTLFTPAGIDIYSRRKEDLAEATLEAIKKALVSIESEDVSKLARELFVVKSD